MSKNAASWVVRFKNPLLRLLKNKMSFSGIIILSLFIVLAIGAEVWTPYIPQGTIVSGVDNPPAWIPAVTGQRDWSLNAAFSNLDVSASNAGTVISISERSEESVTFSVRPPNTSGTSISVLKTLTYQYDGSPKSYTGSIPKVAVQGLSDTVGASVQVYVIRQVEGGQKYCCFWKRDNLTGPGPYSPAVGFLSNDASHKTNLGLGETPYSPAQIIFNQKADYVFALEITLPPGVSQASFVVQNFNLQLWGSVFGLLGTDTSGTDLFTQLAHGARVSLYVGLLATFLGIGVGLVVGLLAGFIGGVVDEVLMRFTDMMLVLPGLPLLIVLVAVLGSSTFNIIMVLGLLGWMGFARVIRSQVLSIRERPFIEAAKASGAGTGYITTRHVFPNIVGLTYVNLALSVPGAIVGEAALSFLGLGATGTTWGRMLEGARNAGAASGNLLWWWVIPPGICIAVLSLSFILIGYALDDIFNPRLRKRR